jgi:hypothetical protein
VIDLRSVYGDISVHATADAEHEAVVDLLLLVAFTDHRIRIGEMDEISAVVDDLGWESATFSVGQYLGEGVAKVRAAIEAPEPAAAVDALLADVDHRIHNTVLRRAVAGFARGVADADHDRSLSETALVDKIRERFAS